jgi:hypothetical protein
LRAGAACSIAAAVLLGCTAPNPAFEIDPDAATPDLGSAQTGGAGGGGTGGGDVADGQGGEMGGGTGGDATGGMGPATGGTGGEAAGGMGPATGGAGGDATGGMGPATGGAGGADPSPGTGGAPVDSAPVDQAPPADAAPRDVRVVDAVGPGMRGLVLYWRLDESSGTVAQDSSGRGLNGTYQGSTLPTPDADSAPTGFANQASRRFAIASTNSIRLEGSPAALQPSTGVTVSVWFRTTQTTRVDLVCFGSDYFLRYASGVLEFVRRRPAGSTPIYVTASGNAVAHDGAWHNAVGVADLTGTRVWLDGRRVNIDVSQLPFTYMAGSAFSVGRSAAGNQPLEGLIDEVRVYDRALGDDEVKALALGAN